MRVPKVLAVSIAAIAVLASLLTPASADTAGPVIDNTSLMNGGLPCSTSTPPALGFFANQLQALGSDPAPSLDRQYHFTFAIWPQSDPTAVTTFTVTNYGPGQLVRGKVPYGTLISGTSYSWRIQLSDTNGTSPWSQTCIFSYDYTAPQPPTISSNYPPNTPGPVGELAQFTFSGNGDPDTAGFAWAWGDELPSPTCSDSGPQFQLICPDPLSVPGVLRADTPGGTASLTMNAPHDGPIDLTVAAVDRAGNRSRQVTYRLFVPYSGPTVTVTTAQPICGGNTATVSFVPYPGVSGVVSYTYTLLGGNGQQVTVQADSAGEATATVDVSSQPYAITASSLSSNGFRSSTGYASLDVNPQPTVTSDVYQDSGQPTGGAGIPGTFTFTPPYDGHQVISYQYRFFHDGALKTVLVDPNGQPTTVQWTPPRSGEQTLTVQGLYGDVPGGSCQASYTFVVASRAEPEPSPWTVGLP